MPSSRLCRPRRSLSYNRPTRQFCRERLPVSALRRSATRRIYTIGRQMELIWPMVLISPESLTAPGIAMSTLWSFTDGNSGEFIYSPLAQGKDGNFYGTTIEGGSSGVGTVFKVTTNGSLTTLFSFNINNGAIPYGGLVLGKDSLFYGTAFEGGTYGDGTMFKITTAGSFTSLTTFNGNNGMFPVAGLVQGSDGNFYGTALEGGVYGYGTIFRMTTSGVLTTLASFNNTDGRSE